MRNSPFMALAAAALMQGVGIGDFASLGNEPQRAKPKRKPKSKPYAPTDQPMSRQQRRFAERKARKTRP